MRKNIIILILISTWFYSCGQKYKSATDEISIDSEKIDATISIKDKLSLNNELEKYIYTDSSYKTPNGTKISIQNSFPKGGSIGLGGTQYLDSSGKKHAFAVFWTRIINESNTPLELHINFPSDSSAIFTPPDAYLKLFLPTDTITIDKLSSFNYGLTELKSYLDANFNKATMLQTTINPNEDYIFYVATLSYQASGTPRAALILKEQDLYYRMSIAPFGYGIIPCGKITFK